MPDWCGATISANASPGVRAHEEIDEQSPGVPARGTPSAPGIGGKATCCIAPDRFPQIEVLPFSPRARSLVPQIVQISGI
jgi:hypothetical protein